MSYLTRSSNVRSDRPFTCQRLVIPGGTRMISVASGRSSSYEDHDEVCGRRRIPRGAQLVGVEQILEVLVTAVTHGAELQDLDRYPASAQAPATGR